MSFVTRSEFREVLLNLVSEIQKLREKVREIGNRRDAAQDSNKPTSTAIKLDAVSSVETRTQIAEQKQERNYQFWSLSIQVLTLLAVGAYAIITARMWCEMQTQTTLVRENFRADERPWIFADGHLDKGQAALSPWLTNNVTSGYTFNISVQFSNVGKTPAFIVDTMPVELKMGPREEIDKEMQLFRPHYSGLQNWNVIPQSLAKPLTLAQSSNNLFVKMEEFTKIADGTWHAYIVGAIKYRDNFKPAIPPYETFVCIYYNPSGIPLGHVPSCGYMQ